MEVESSPVHSVVDRRHDLAWLETKNASFKKVPSSRLPLLPSTTDHLSPTHAEVENRENCVFVRCWAEDATLTRMTQGALRNCLSRMACSAEFGNQTERAARCSRHGAPQSSEVGFYFSVSSDFSANTVSSINASSLLRSFSISSLNRSSESI